MLSTSENPQNGTSLLLAGPKKTIEAGPVVYLEAVDSTAGQTQQPRGLDEYWQVLRNRKIFVALLFLLGGGAGWLVSTLIAPIYQAVTTLEVQPPHENAFLDSADAGTGSGVQPEVYLQTQIKVLQSRSLRRRAEAVLQQQGNTYRVLDPLEKWRSLIRMRQPATPQRGARLAAVQVQVRVDGTSRIIEIRAYAPNAQLATDYANVLANQYIDSSLEAMWASAQRTSDWLNRQLEEMRKKLQDSENALQAYSRETGLVYAGESQSVDEDELKKLQDEASRATIDRMLKQAAFEVASSSSAESVPAVADNPRLNGYVTKLSELRWTLADLTALYTPSHYKVKQVQAQIEELEGLLKQEREDILKRINNDYQAALRHEKMVSSLYARQLQRISEDGNKAVYYGILKRDVETNRQVYEQLLQRTKQVSIGSALHASNSRIVDAAEIPRYPTRPDPLRNTATGAAGGLLLAISLILAREFINRTVQSPGETAFHLRVPELGVIPARTSLPARAEVSPAHRLLSLRSAAHTDGVQEPPELISWHDRPSMIAESFRSVLASIMVSKGWNARRRVLLVTSPSRGEGKSSVVTNLGIALAEINQKVLLVDADMRKPRLHEIFDVPNSWGLSDLLRERQSLADCPLEGLARPTKIEGLSLLPAGPGTASIATLLYSKRLSDLIERFRVEFDIVLLDTPPMSYLFDARVLGQSADGAILVLRAGQTTRDAALSAKQRMMEDGIPILGTILNGWDVKSKHRYGCSPYPYTNSSY